MINLPKMPPIRQEDVTMSRWVLKGKEEKTRNVTIQKIADDVLNSGLIDTRTRTLKSSIFMKIKDTFTKALKAFASIFKKREFLPQTSKEKIIDYIVAKANYDLDNSTLDTLEKARSKVLHDSDLRLICNDSKLWVPDFLIENSKAFISPMNKASLP